MQDTPITVITYETEMEMKPNRLYSVPATRILKHGEEMLCVGVGNELNGALRSSGLRVRI
ncbi:hypothetical protein EYZ11_012833 [Aspergillus tanneri]|uniref:Uncharacterized protein n=1 Tax=Aspergillus tanneri TaxID=1220188 RepID=A0A4S3IZ89_9EURO|nr:hypothetical protein EYZ11_012833 [Aspergillus tanneri]